MAGSGRRRRSRLRRHDPADEERLPSPPPVARAADRAGTGVIRPDAPAQALDVAAVQRQAGNRAAGELLTVARTPAGATATATATAAAPGPAGAAHATPTPAATPEPPTAWIAELPGHVQAQIDQFSQAQLDTASTKERQRLEGLRATNRRTFMITMRWLFGSDAATEAHFREIKPMANSANWPLWAHVSTRERLQAVLEDLKTQGHPMPDTSVGLGLRGDHLHPGKHSPGYFTHATGFAIDWKATAAPHILGAEGAKLDVLLQTVTGSRTHFDLGMGMKQRLDLIEAMGQGKADKDQASALLTRVEEQYKKLTAASNKFKTDLPQANLARLRALTESVDGARTAVSEAAGKLKRLRGGRAAKDVIAVAEQALADAVAEQEKQLAEARAALPEIFRPWTTLLDTEIKAIDDRAAAKGVDLNRLAGDWYFTDAAQRLTGLKAGERRALGTAKAAHAQVVQLEREITALAARVEAARAWLAAPGARPPDPLDAARWSEALEGCAAKLAAAAGTLASQRQAAEPVLAVGPPAARPIPPIKPTAMSNTAVKGLVTGVDRLTGKATPAAAKLGQSTTPLTKAQADVAALSSEITDRRTYRAERVAAHGGSGAKGRTGPGDAVVAALLRDKVRWIALKGAKEGLERDAEGFVFKASVGDDRARNPAIVQLLGMRRGTRGGGFFTADPEAGGKPGTWSYEHGFNLAFFKSMVSHGFELGVAWEGHADTMHFELVEGRRLLESGGSKALTAGATLRAEEERLEAERAAAAKAAAAKGQPAGPGASGPTATPPPAGG